MPPGDAGRRRPRAARQRFSTSMQIPCTFAATAITVRSMPLTYTPETSRPDVRLDTSLELLFDHSLSSEPRVLATVVATRAHLSQGRRPHAHPGKWQLCGAPQRRLP